MLPTMKLSTSILRLSSFCSNLSSRSICIQKRNNALINNNQIKVIGKFSFLNANCYYSNINTTEEIDDNDKALQELDITLLKPHPEWRNVATGPVWGKNNEYFELLWQHWLDNPFEKRDKVKQDEEWEEYLQKYGFSPIDYLNSEEYYEKYQEKKVWVGYVRNKKGFIQPQKTRKSCKRDDVIDTGSPCPLCRDDELLLTYKNIQLLTQFIDHLTGKLHVSLRTGLCQVQFQRLETSFNLAQEFGFFSRSTPFVKYDLKSYKRNSPVL